MTHAQVSYLPGRSATRPDPRCTATAITIPHPVGEVAASAAQLADAWRLWTCTRQPAALHDVQRHLADVVLAAATAAWLIDPDAMTGEPDPAA